jgi:nitrogen fixation/metabolism regulation signal transduction histidine kinase
MATTKPAEPSSLLQRQSRTMRWALGVGLGVIAALALVLLFLLTQATGNRELYERNYALLFGLNIGVATLLLIVIGWIVLRLLVRLRQRKFGSRLLVKLAAIFALVGLMPGLMIYVVSYQFVSRSIESWFDVEVETALDAALKLGRVTLDTLAADLGNRTRQAATQLAQDDGASPSLAVERLREQLAVRDVALWSASGQLLASSGESRLLLQPERPTTQQLRQARSKRVVTQIDGLDDNLPLPDAEAAANAGAPAGGSSGAASAVGPLRQPPRIKAIALVSESSFGLAGSDRFLQFTEILPADLVANALAVQEANREYQERALARNGLRRMYIGTLTLSLFLAVFGAVLLAVLLGTQLARPLLLLAEGVRQVAQGDLRPKAVLESKDELGGLTRSFAEMTQQLADARFAVQKSMIQVDAARADLQTILDNLSAGVLVLDTQGRIRSSNPAAARILHLSLAEQQGQALRELPGLQEFGQAVQARFDSYLHETTDHDLAPWQQTFELHGGLAQVQDRAVTLIARGARMPGTQECLLVFDDVSEMVSAQRAQAWGEVARRLAHEIKNPLTPIQLSAERLAMKLAPKLEPTEQAFLGKSVKTIVDQVDAMKRLVNEFRDYARLPAAELHALDLNALVQDVMQLYAHGTSAPIQLELDPQAPLIRGDAQQLRQVMHNLLQNALDAQETLAAQTTQLPGPVVLKTEYSATSQRVRLIVRDNGAGFPDNILKRAFEPYVTTKSKGTGLGLAVVKKIADEHGARIDISNRMAAGVPQGAQVSLSFAVAA